MVYSHYLFFPFQLLFLSPYLLLFLFLEVLKHFTQFVLHAAHQCEHHHHTNVLQGLNQEQ